MLCEPADQAAEDPVDETDKRPAESDGEEGQEGHEDVLVSHGSCQGGECVHGVVEDDTYSIVEE